MVTVAAMFSGVGMAHAQAGRGAATDAPHAAASAPAPTAPPVGGGAVDLGRAWQLDPPTSSDAVSTLVSCGEWHAMMRQALSVRP